MESIRLTRHQWTERRRTHTERAERLLAPVVERRRVGARHPIEDFLFDYYRLRPSELIRWSPGAFVELDQAPEFVDQKFHRVDADQRAFVDLAAVLAKRAGTVAFTHRLLTQTAGRPPQFGCFGMHEWAMVYRLPAEQLRHQALPLRLSAEQTDEVVQSADLRCSHFDAFRFFTPEATGLNRQPLTREDQLLSDQAGCLHVNMDLYKWAGKLVPLVSSELLLDSYRLARDIRVLDMRASPYDVTAWGWTAVPVETAEGKAEYVSAQREFSGRAAILRAQLLAVTQRLVDLPSPCPPA